MVAEGQAEDKGEFNTLVAAGRASQRVHSSALCSNKGSRHGKRVQMQSEAMLGLHWGHTFSKRERTRKAGKQRLNFKVDHSPHAISQLRSTTGKRKAQSDSHALAQVPHLNYAALGLGNTSSYSPHPLVLLSNITSAPFNSFSLSWSCALCPLLSLYHHLGQPYISDRIATAP